MNVSHEYEDRSRTYYDVRPGEHAAIVTALHQMITRWEEQGNGYMPGYIQIAKIIIDDNRSAMRS